MKFITQISMRKAFAAVSGCGCRRAWYLTNS
jgi:hypothetical protein